MRPKKQLHKGCMFLLAFALSIMTAASFARAQEGVGIISSGDAAVTGFSGTIDNGGQKTINPDGASLRVFDLSQKGAPRGQLINAPVKHESFARDIGQAFGVTLDNATPPNIYVTATSAYGLSIVDAAGAPLKNGAPGAQFMPGQFGQAGGPGSVWKIDGKTGQATLFATLKSEGADNSGAGLGNIVFDPSHYQFYVSDLDSGLIHRLDMQGNVIDTFDHGATGRPAGGLDAVAIDPANKLDITSPDFDTENSDTWALTDVRRRVWGMAYYKGRLYYSPTEGPQVWSVGVNQDGSFAGDAKIEIQAVPGGFPVSDMLFTPAGKMIVAQRGGLLGSADYTQFHTPKADSVLRYTRDATGQWIQEPKEYAIGFPVDHKNASGGVGLACKNILWSTGDALRDNPALPNLALDGETVVHGLQGNDVSSVRPRNTPPWASWFVDYDGQFNDPEKAGHVGDVAIYRDCQPGFAESWPGWEPGWTPPDNWIPPYWWPEYPDLELWKDDTQCDYVGLSLILNCTFTITVTNVGSVPYTGPLNVVDNVPAGVTFIPPAGGSIPWNCGQAGMGAPIACVSANIVTLLPGQSETLKLTVHRIGGQWGKRFKNCAIVNNDPYTANNEDCGYGYYPGPDLEMKKTLDICYPVAGGNVCEYFLDATNKGNAPFVGTVHIKDTLPAGTFFDGVIASNDPGWWCVAGGGQVDCALGPTTIPVGGWKWVEIAIFIPDGSPSGLKNCAKLGSWTFPLDPNINGNNKDCAPVVSPAEFDPQFRKSNRKMCPANWTMQAPGWVKPDGWEVKTVGPLTCGRKKPKKKAHCPRGWNRYPDTASVPKGWDVKKVGDLTCAKYKPRTPTTPTTPTPEGPKCNYKERTFSSRTSVPRGWTVRRVSRGGVTIWCGTRKPTRLFCNGEDRQISGPRSAPKGYKAYTKTKNGKTIWCAKWVPPVKVYCPRGEKPASGPYASGAYRYKTRNGSIWCIKPVKVYCPRGERQTTDRYAPGAYLYRTRAGSVWCIKRPVKIYCPKGQTETRDRYAPGAYQYRTRNGSIWCIKRGTNTGPRCNRGESTYRSRNSVPRGWTWRRVAANHLVIYCAKKPRGNSRSCPSNMYYDTGARTCMPKRTSVTCGPNQHLSRNGKRCINNRVICRKGTHLSRNGRSCIPNRVFCKPGTHLSGNRCVRDRVTIRCSGGFHLSKGRCVRNNTGLTATPTLRKRNPRVRIFRGCPRGQIMIEGKCSRTSN